MKVVEERKTLYIFIEETLTVLVKSSDVSNARWLQTTLTEVRTLWTAVTTLTESTLVKLVQALDSAQRFDELTNTMEFWLTRIEGSVSLFEVVSTIIENLEKQKVQFKVGFISLVSETTKDKDVYVVVFIEKSITIHSWTNSNITNLWFLLLEQQRTFGCKNHFSLTSCS